MIFCSSKSKNFYLLKEFFFYLFVCFFLFLCVCVLRMGEVVQWVYFMRNSMYIVYNKKNYVVTSMHIWKRFFLFFFGEKSVSFKTLQLYNWLFIERKLRLHFNSKKKTKTEKIKCKWFLHGILPFKQSVERNWKLDTGHIIHIFF